MQFRDFMSIIRMRWPILVICMLLAVAGAAAVDYRTTPIYQSHTRVFLAASGAGYALSSSDLKTYVELLGSPVVQDPLRQRLGLPADTPVDVSGSVSVGSPILDITARSTSPQLAANLANAVGPTLADIGGQYAPLLRSQKQTVKATTITPAVPSSTPLSPTPRRDMALAALAGFALGLGLMLLRHYADTRIHGETEIAQWSDKPILGRLLKLRDAAANPLAMVSDPHGVAAENYRKLVTNLQFVDVTTGGRHSFQISSPMPGDGKTLTAVNVALAAANTGTKVLLVDCDLRHPSVARTMGLEGGVGVTTVLLRQASLDDVIQPWGDTALSVLPAGEIPPNPTELSGSEAMATLFDELLARFDLVIVDSPPINPVADPIVINRLVGGLVVLTTVGRTRKRDLHAALKALATAGIEPVGFALNQVTVSGVKRYGYYYSETSKAAAQGRRAVA
ncbi:MAG TPA: polysaccharide biosynthesis tyrosine autokinase [Propionibacteriaceae bacterium]|nr:polysaccharide biosynthesis tyrosine autokinase [Propionibacteriaceae bacterium]